MKEATSLEKYPRELLEAISMHRRFVRQAQSGHLKALGNGWTRTRIKRHIKASTQSRLDMAAKHGVIGYDGGLFWDLPDASFPDASEIIARVVPKYRP